MELAIDFFKRARRLITVEIARKRNLVTNLGLLLINPGVRYVRLYFGLEIRLDSLIARGISLGITVVGERYPLGITQARIRLYLAASIGDNPRRSHHAEDAQR